MPKGSGIPVNEAIPMLADALAYYDEADVERWFERNKRMTGHMPVVYSSTIEDVRTFKKVPNEPFRKAWVDMQRPMVLGFPQEHGDNHINKIPVSGMARFDGIVEPRLEPEWCGRFRDELLRVINLPEALDFRPAKIGPSDLSCQRLGDYLRSALGIKESTGTGGISLKWLVQYEVAEALCKTLGLTPYTVGI